MESNSALRQCLRNSTVSRNFDMSAHAQYALTCGDSSATKDYRIPLKGLYCLGMGDNTYFAFDTIPILLMASIVDIGTINY